jgi:hypothetical protein
MPHPSPYTPPVWGILDREKRRRRSEGLYELEKAFGAVIAATTAAQRSSPPRFVPKSWGRAVGLLLKPLLTGLVRQ